MTVLVTLPSRTYVRYYLTPAEIRPVSCMNVGGLMKQIFRGWIKTTFSVLAAFVVIGAAQSLWAQGPAPASTPQPDTQPDVQMLKERVKQLEQTVEELKRQIGLVEDKQKTSVAPAVANQASTAASTLPATIPADKPKSQNGESTFQIYGFAMLDAGYDFKSNNPDWYDVIRPTKLPAFRGEFNPEGKTYFGVRQSRLGVKYNTPTKYGELKTIFEFELFGTGVDAGQTTFRLRHAYGELGHFGAGQYWTVFGDTDAYPNTFEYWGPNGLVWFRNIQFRWMPLKGRNSVTIGLEKPGASADPGTLSGRIELEGVKPQFSWPDLTGHVRFDRNWGHVQFSGVVRSMKWKDVNNDNIDLSGSAVGYGGSISSHLNFGKRDVGRFQATYGTGIENYMNDAPVDVGVKIISGNTIKGVTLPVFGTSLFLDHTWNKKFTSSTGYSMLNIQNSNGQAPDAFHRGHYALANLLYSPVDNVTIGGEFQWGRRENFLDGFGVNDFRIQFGFKYNFSKTFKFAD